MRECSARYLPRNFAGIPVNSDGISVKLNIRGIRSIGRSSLGSNGVWTGTGAVLFCGLLLCY